MQITIRAFDGPNYVGELQVEWDQPQTLDYFISLAKEAYPTGYRIEIHYVQS
jgi:hypothetical protein